MLPLSLANDLTPPEYANLVEGISANSPIDPSRGSKTLPYSDLASHVLGYVGSGYEPTLRDYREMI